MKYKNHQKWEREAKRYYASSKWKAICKKALQRAGGKCQACPNRDGRKLNVHHNNYENWKNETVYDLVVLCTQCHDLIHGRNGNKAKAKQKRCVVSHSKCNWCGDDLPNGGYDKNQIVNKHYVKFCSRHCASLGRSMKKYDDD